jgi:formiminotetrahydrofolate cyclodeaminase
LSKIEEHVSTCTEGVRRTMANSASTARTCGPGLEEFVRSVACASPLLPGGGSVTALAGSLAAALGEMMSGVTEGRKKFAAVDAQVREVHAKLTKLRDALMVLIQEDSVAFDSAMHAFKLSRETEAQRVTRLEAIEKTLRFATDTQLRIARASFEVLEYVRVLIEIGNQNARCDAAVGMQMAYASLKGTQYNILANTSSIGDKDFAKKCRTEVLDLAQRGQELLQQVDKIIIGL